MKEKIFAYIYPAPENVINNIFEKKKGFLVKYQSREPTKKTKTNAMKVKHVFFYQSGGNKQIVGKANVIKIQYCKASDAIDVFGEDLLINKKDFVDYIKGREERNLIVFYISSAKKFDKPAAAIRPITMAGQYFAKGELKKFIKV